MNFWNSHLDVARDFEDALEINFKEMARGEITFEDIVAELEKEYSIEIPRDILKNLDMLDAGYRKNWNKIKKRKYRK